MRLALSALFFLAVLPASAYPQALTDPMRPPAFDPASTASVDAASSRLKSTLLSNGRRLAIIDGQTVPLGGRIGDATLVEITPTKVILRRGSETEALLLLPSAEKKPSGRVAPASASPGETAK